MSHRALTDCHFPHASSGGPRAGAPVTFCPGPAKSELYFGHERCPFLACTGPEKLLYMLEIVFFFYSKKRETPGDCPHRDPEERARQGKTETWEPKSMSVCGHTPEASAQSGTPRELRASGR